MIYMTRKILATFLFLLPITTLAGEIKVNFENNSLEGWRFTDTSAWEIVDSGAKDGHHNVLALTKRSKYTPKVRSPESIALLTAVDAGSFVLDIDVKSTSKAEPHQDLCLFFNHVDAEHFYYVHLGRQADPHAHSIFLVNNEPRVSIAKERTDGTPWTDGWHKVRIERNTKTGHIKVYFDDMKNPVMQAVDKSFTSGAIGIGSFDNTGYFDNLSIKTLD